MNTSKQNKHFYHEDIYYGDIYYGDIYYANLMDGFGSVQGGYRPVLVIQNDMGNKYSPTTIVAPLSSKILKFRNGLVTHVYLHAEECNLRNNSFVMLEQIRVIDKKQLKFFITSLDDKKMKRVEEAIQTSFRRMPHMQFVA